MAARSRANCRNRSAGAAATEGRGCAGPGPPRPGRCPRARRWRLGAPFLWPGRRSDPSSCSSPARPRPARRCAAAPVDEGHRRLMVMYSATASASARPISRPTIRPRANPAALRFHAVSERVDRGHALRGRDAPAPPARCAAPGAWPPAARCVRGPARGRRPGSVRSRSSCGRRRRRRAGRRRCRAAPVGRGAAQHLGNGQFEHQRAASLGAVSSVIGRRRGVRRRRTSTNWDHRADARVRVLHVEDRVLVVGLRARSTSKTNSVSALRLSMKKRTASRPVQSTRSRSVYRSCRRAWRSSPSSPPFITVTILYST